MFRNLDNQSEQNDRQHHVRVTQRLIGVEGEEEYFVRLEVERVRKAAEERQANLLAEERERDRALHFMKARGAECNLKRLLSAMFASTSVSLATASGWIRGNWILSERKMAASWGGC